MNIISELKKRIGLVANDFVTTVATWSGVYPTYPDWNFGTLARGGFSGNTLIFACIEKTASTTAQVKMQLLDRETEEVIPDHPMAQLLDRPNALMTEYDFWASVVVYLKLSGNAYYLKNRNEAGAVTGLWPLRPDWVTPKLGDLGRLYYRVAPFGLEPKNIDPSDILRFKYFNPSNPLMGHSPAQVAGRILSIDNSATDYVKLFFEEGGSPPGLLTTVQKLTDAQAESIRTRWRTQYGGARNWHKPVVLDSDAQYQKLGSSIKEMAFDSLDARNEARICSVMGVPPIIVGAKVGLDRSTYSNYEEARKSWWQDTLMGLYRLLSDAVNEQLARDFDPARRFKFQWNFTEVPALMEDDTKRWERATMAFEAGAITRNEFYSLVGMEELGPSGDVYLMPFNRSESPQPLKTIAYPRLTGPKQEESDPDDPDTPRDAPNDAERRKVEQGMYEDLSDFQTKYLERLGKEVESRNVRSSGPGKNDLTPQEGKPTPDSGESEQEFISRCISQVIEDGTADNVDQATAICYSIWEADQESED